MMTDRILADSNVVIYTLQGLQHVRQLLDKRSVFISFITEVELLSFHKNTIQDIQHIGEFIKYSHILEYSIQIKNIAIDIRKKYRLNLPDAFIAASAIEYNLPLISADPVFAKISELTFSKIEP
jgi:predicted nucleic acid-binding protein